MWFRHALSRRLFAILWATTAALVIGLALLVSVARLLLPLLDHYRVELQQVASAQVGRQVEIGGISAGWQGLHPDLRFRDVRVLTADGLQTWLSMREVRASVNIFESLRRRRLETGQISLVGGSLDIARRADGSYSVAGIDTGFGGVAGHGGHGLLEWLMGRDRVSLEDATVRWRDPRISTAPLEISQLNLDLRRIDGRYRLGGGGQLEGSPQGRLRFALDLSGDPLQPSTLRSQFYMEGRVVAGSWLDGSSFADVERVFGSVHFQLWADGADRLDRLRGELNGRDLVWQPRIAAEQGGPVAPVALDQASANLFWTQDQRGWRLALDHVHVVRDALQWPETSLRMAVADTEEHGQRWELTTPFVRLQDVNAVLQTIPGLTPQLRYAAAALAPRGDLRQLALLYDPSAPGTGLFAGFQFQDLSARPWQRFPGLEGVDGSVRTDGEHGFLSLDSKQARFTYARLFREPLHAQRLTGALYWHPQGDGVRFYAPRFSASNEDVSASGRMRVDLPGSGASPFLDLLVDFRDGHGAQAPHYLPTGIMPPKVVHWLDQALASGHVPSGRALYFGRLSDFPFAEQGTFRVDFGVENLILDYAEGWPRLEDGTAGIRFSDRSMSADIYSGKILGLDIGRSRLAIPQMGDRAVLELDTRAQGTLTDFLTYLRRGPLSDSPPPMLDQIKAKKDARTTLKLRLPFHAAKQVQIDGTVQFNHNQLSWPLHDLDFENLQGALNFSYRDRRVSYAADDLRMRWRTAPASMTIQSSAVGDETQVQLNVHTRNGLGQLLSAPMPLLDRVLRGATDWDLRATVHQPRDEAAPIKMDLQARSELHGLEVALPAPLAKAPDTARPLLVSASVTGTTLDQVRFYYGSVLNGVFRVADSKLQAGELRFGAAQAAVPDQTGLRIRGAIAQLSVSEWRRWVNSVDRGRANAEGWIAQLNALDLRVDTLNALGNDVHDLHLVASRSPDQWLAGIEAQEIEGQVRVPVGTSAKAPVMATLSKLRLSATDDPEASPDSDFEPDPASVPALRIEVEHFFYDETDLGQMVLAAEPMPDGLRVSQLSIDSPRLNATATGQWRNAAQGEVCDFTINASTADLGQLLTASGYADTVKRGAGTFHIEAQWPGSPADFKLKELDGKLRLQIRDGQLLELNPRGGRVFGLLSLQALPRRLSLDFSDLVQRGFAFDRIEGTFTIANGDAYTNDLYMEGPAARVDVAGRIGLAAEDYDQTALVTPRVSSSIPVVGGLAGGPAVGLGLWVAERIFGKKIDEMSRVRYNVTGPWRDPQVKRADEPG